MTKQTVLLIEDNEKLNDGNRRMLESKGYKVLTALNLDEARELLADFTPDIILLDIMLPDGSGLEYLKEIRADGNAVPVIMLTALDETEDKVNGFNTGANDYLGKPFDYEELLARIESVIRSSFAIPEKLELGSIVLEPISGRGSINGIDMLLTQKEFAVLLLLFHNENRGINAENLYSRVWGRDILGGKRALENTISRLRQKLRDGDYIISYDYKNGYIFERG